MSEPDDLAALGQQLGFNREARRVSVYVSSLTGLDTGIEYARAFSEQGVDAVLCLDPGINDAATAVADDSGVPWVKLAGLSRREERCVRAHRNLVNIGTSFVAGANSAYREIGPLGGPRTSLKRFTMRLIRCLPGRPTARTWNRWGPNLFGRLLRSRFPTEWVLAVSVAATPLFLCNRRLTVDTIVDSWDHPSRKVAGYPTRTVIAWNEPLAQDWLRFQGAQRWTVAPPRKLTYALEDRSLPEVNRSVATPRLLYPVATSPNVPDVFADELELLRDMGHACRIAGWQLLVKPRPDAVPEMLVDTVDSLEGAVLGRRLKQAGRALDYRLTAEYNTARLEELATADLVVSTVTTFGLDAACAGRPILQMDLRQMADLPALAAISNNHHLRTHLYNLPSVITPKDRGDLVQAVIDALDAGATDPRSKHNSDALRDWVSGEQRSASDVVRELNRMQGTHADDYRRERRSRSA